MTFLLQKNDFNFLKDKIPYAYKMVANIKEKGNLVYFDVEKLVISKMK